MLLLPFFFAGRGTQNRNPFVMPHCAGDSMDADDMTTVADIPPFILLRKAFKALQPLTISSVKFCSKPPHLPRLQSMRDSGSMPLRGGRLQVHCPHQQRSFICIFHAVAVERCRAFHQRSHSKVCRVSCCGCFYVLVTTMAMFVSQNTCTS